MPQNNGKPPVTRRNAFRLLATALTASVLVAVDGKPAEASYGRCTQCGCGGFNGAGSYPLVCQTCGHSWHVHC